MHKRKGLEILLGGVFGAALGSFFTILFLFFDTKHWLIYTPMFFGAVAGIWKGDRALFGLMRMVSWL